MLDALNFSPAMSALEADRIRVADLDAEILALEHSLSALRTQRTLLQDRINAYKYPVLTLPNEIVSQIFIHFLPVYPKCPPTAGILSPFNLTHICRQWREIALASPDLWRAVALPLHPELYVARQTHDWLSRSRSCPLSIKIVWTDCGATMLDAWVLQLFAALTPHRARWEHLTLDLLEIPRLPFEAPMPLLRHLKLFFGNHGHNPMIFGEAPLLRSVILDGPAAQNVVLPWAQLTSLELLFMHPQICFSILQQTRNLIHCQLYPILFRDTTCPADVTLPCLESLSFLSNSSNVPPSGYLHTFIAPALRELHIPEQFLEHPIDSLTSFISKSGCKLRTIHLTGKTKATQETYRSTFPSIPEFSFDGPEVAQDHRSDDSYDSESS